jgi:hypothetical protein
MFFKEKRTKYVYRNFYFTKFVLSQNKEWACGMVNKNNSEHKWKLSKKGIRKKFVFLKDAEGMWLGIAIK